jgi:hypothetical protein
VRRGAACLINALIHSCASGQIIKSDARRRREGCGCGGGTKYISTLRTNAPRSLALNSRSPPHARLIKRILARAPRMQMHTRHPYYMYASGQIEILNTPLSAFAVRVNFVFVEYTLQQKRSGASALERAFLLSNYFLINSSSPLSSFVL